METASHWWGIYWQIHFAPKRIVSGMSDFCQDFCPGMAMFDENMNRIGD